MESIQKIAEKFIQEILEVNVLKGLTQSLEKMGKLTDSFVCRATYQKLQAGLAHKINGCKTEQSRDLHVAAGLSSSRRPCR